MRDIVIVLKPATSACAGRNVNPGAGERSPAAAASAPGPFGDLERGVQPAARPRGSAAHLEPEAPRGFRVGWLGRDEPVLKLE